MRFDDHVASEVSESSQHIGDKFCVVPGLLIANLRVVLHEKNKTIPRLDFHFVHCVFKLWIFDELTELRTVKDASFHLLHCQSWKSLTKGSEAAAILVHSFGELFDQAEPDAPRREEHPASVPRRVVYDVPCSAKH